MIPVRAAQEKNTRNAADSIKRRHCGPHRMVTFDQPDCRALWQRTEISGTVFKSSAGYNFAKQRDATMLRRLHQLIEQTKSLLCLNKNLRVDRCAVKAISLRARLNLAGGFPIFAPIGRCALTMDLHHDHAVRRHSRTV